MKPSSLMLAAACIAMLPVTSHAEPANPYSALQVIGGCRDFVNKTDPDFLSGICVGIVSALAALEPRTTGVCIPEEVTVGQEVRVVFTYIDIRRSNRLHEDFRKLALEALREAWPCR
jgi:hypothetical protein